MPGQSVENCFAHYLPLPLVAPNRGVDPTAQVHLRFSEPMDPTTIDAFGAFAITRSPGACTREMQ